jgi:hypothetical protein
MQHPTLYTIAIVKYKYSISQHFWKIKIYVLVCFYYALVVFIYLKYVFTYLQIHVDEWIFTFNFRVLKKA